jgi:hypothetical protein
MRYSGIYQERLRNAKRNLSGYPEILKNTTRNLSQYSNLRAEVWNWELEIRSKSNTHPTTPFGYESGKETKKQGGRKGSQSCIF